MRVPGAVSSEDAAPRQRGRSQREAPAHEVPGAESRVDSCSGFLFSWGFIFFYAGGRVLVSLQGLLLQLASYGNRPIPIHDGCRLLVSLQGGFFRESFCSHL